MIVIKQSGRPVPGRPMLLGLSLILVTLVSASSGSARSGSANPGEPAMPDAQTVPDAQTIIVTSDSRAYCRTLSIAIEAHGPLPREVSDLKAEGDGLCGEGQVRGGIARLRRALMVLHQDPPAGAPRPR